MSRSGETEFILTVILPPISRKFRAALELSGAGRTGAQAQARWTLARLEAVKAQLIVAGIGVDG